MANHKEKYTLYRGRRWLYDIMSPNQLRHCSHCERKMYEGEYSHFSPSIVGSCTMAICKECYDNYEYPMLRTKTENTNA